MSNSGHISNYANGFLNGVTIRGVPLQQTHSGEVFWVNSTTVLSKGGVGASDGNRGTYTKPYSTLDFAVGQCKASRGDIIVLMPGYTETISTATALALDVAGECVHAVGKVVAYSDCRKLRACLVEPGYLLLVALHPDAFLLHIHAHAGHTL